MALKRSITRMSLAVFVFTLLAVNAVAYQHARAMLRFSGDAPKTKNPEHLGLFDKLGVLLTGISNPRPMDTTTPDAFGLSYAPHRIPVADGITLAAWLIPHETSVGSAILFHGYTGAKSSLLIEAQAFHARGYSVLLVDFRGSSGSSEAYTTVGYREADDVKAAVHYASRELGFDAPVLYGRSMGAAALTRAAAIHDLPVRALVLESVFDTMLNTVKQRFEAMGVPATPFAHLLVFWGGLQYGFWGFDHNPSTYAHSCRLPVLVLHGSEDPRATLAQARSVFDALAGPRTFVEFAGAGHEPLPSFDRRRWDDAVDTLLAEVIVSP